MNKWDEMTDKNSCLSKSKDNEPLFVLCGRDVAAPETIKQWIEERIRLGKNKRDDEKIIEAYAAIAKFNTYRETH
jgi:hypothetical protein